MNRFTLYRILIVCVVLLIGFACSTEKNTPLNRTFHNVNSKYNVLFNGNESYKEGVQNYNKSFQDDYSRLLPIFVYGNTSQSQSIKPQMDRAIEKASKLIDKHSITAKPDIKKGSLSEKEKEYLRKSEYNAFVDDAYYLMGRAQFWAMEYQAAERTFLYILSKYDDEEILYFTNIWLARTYIQTNEFKDAKTILGHIEIDKVELKQQIHYHTTLADVYVKEENLDEAISTMELVVEMAKRKDDKVRYNFILAQMYEMQGLSRKAYDTYGKVVKLNPDYEMNFNASIKQASLSSGVGGQEKQQLLKMLKDDKNIEYQDQIYYALGLIAKAENNTPQSIEYYKSSIATSVDNTTQKGLSYLALAEIYYDQKDYIPAQAYYDSTVTTLDMDYPNYTELYMMNINLSKLVVNVNEFQLQDSLQRLAKMDTKERDALIQEFIADVIEQERIERERLQEARENNLLTTGPVRYNSQFGEGGKWYFYSQTAKSYGQPEFQRKWGSRKLEDNWRRKNKNSVSFDLGGDQIAEGDSLTQKGGEALSNKSKEFYLKDLPLTDSLMDVSNKKMEKALYNMATIYLNDFKNNEKAIEAYKELITRFPDTEYKSAVYYYLATIYDEEKDYSNSEIYKNLVLRNYPESIYAKILTNPDYYKEFEQEQQVKYKLYEDILNLYGQKQYSKVITDCEEGLRLYPDSDLSPKLSYMIAISKGKLYGVNVLRTELTAIAENFRGDTIGQRAEELLAYLKENELDQLSELNQTQFSADTKELTDTSSINQSEMLESDQLYTFEENTQYYFNLVIDKNVDINQLRFNIINFNLDFYLQEDYNTESKELNEFLEIVSVKRFENLEEAMDYYEMFNSKTDRVMSEFQEVNYQYFVITVDNYIALIKEKSISDYLIFFREKHLK